MCHRCSHIRVYHCEWSRASGYNRTIVNEIVFLIEEDPEGGYTARVLGEPIFTEGETVDEIREAIREAPRTHFDDTTQLPLIQTHLLPS